MFKKNFRNVIFVAIILIIVSFCFYQIVPVFASNDIATGLDTVGAGAGLVKADIKVTIGNIIRVILGFLGIIALGLVLYGGYLYMTSGGEPAKVEKAKQYLMNAVIGMAIILLSYAIVSYVISQIKGSLIISDYTYQCQDGIDNDSDGKCDYAGCGAMVADDACLSETHYTESSLGISNLDYYLQTKNITSGTKNILNVVPRIEFNKTVKDTTVTAVNVEIKPTTATTTTSKVNRIVAVAPSLVTEANGHGTQILSDIKTKDKVFNADYIVANSSTLGNSPMVVEFDMAGVGGDYPDGAVGVLKSLKLRFETSKASGTTPFFVSCSKDGIDENYITAKEEGFDLGTYWGEQVIDLDSACLGGDKVYVKWRRTANGVKFDYMALDVTEEVTTTTPIATTPVSGTLHVSGAVVEYPQELVLQKQWKGTL